MAKGLPPPNHTQTPNLFFDNVLPKIKSLAELKVILIVTRQTFGWHKDKDKLSISRLQQLTGLTRQGVISGTERAVSDGFICKEADGDSYSYSLVVVNDLDYPPAVASQQNRPELVNVVDQRVVNEIDPQKKRKKKVKKEEGASAQLKDELLSGIPLLRDVAQAYPSKESWARYLEILGENPDEAKLRKCRAEWVDRGYNKISWKWFTEWYVKGIEDRNGHKPNSQGARTYEWMGKLYALDDVISDDGQRYTVMGPDGTPTRRWHNLEAFAVDKGITLEQAKHGMNA